MARKTNWHLKKLNLRQRAVADFYLADPARNQTKAYRKAYTKASAATAANCAARLFAQPAMQAYIEAKLAPKLKKLDVTQERILREMAAIAFFDPGQIFDEHGRMLPIPKLPEEVRRAISGFDYVKQGKRTVVRPRFVSKDACLRMLGLTQRMFVERFEGKVGKSHEEALDELEK